jgi:hypothetical protein
LFIISSFYAVFGLLRHLALGPFAPIISNIFASNQQYRRTAQLSWVLMHMGILILYFYLRKGNFCRYSCGPHGPL